MDKRKRKLLVVLPIITLPFLTLAFAALGGGQLQTGPLKKAEGLNLQLPNAHIKEDRGENKLSFYEQADRDSAKEVQGKEPALQFIPPSGDSSGSKKPAYDPYPSKFQNINDPNERKVYQKLAELNRQLNASHENKIAGGASGSEKKENFLDSSLENFHQKDTTTDDPELRNLNGMMDKILDIQHPDRMKERLKEQSNGNKETIYAVQPASEVFSIGTLDTLKKKYREYTGFFSPDEEPVFQQGNAIDAVVHETQTLVNGAVIKLRILHDISINGNHQAKDQFVYGTVLLNGERLLIEVSSIRIQNSLYPVKLQAYDLDGLPGIYIPGALTREVAKSSLDNATQMMEISSLDPTLIAQATTAGIDAVKTLLSKKVKLVKVMVKANYKVLLK